MTRAIRTCLAQILACSVAILACSPPPPTTPKPAPDGTFEGTCEDMCQAFKRLGCKAADPSPVLGVSCVDRCRTQLATDVVAPPIGCIVKARDEGELEDLCGERCK